ncbi:MAG: flagellar protein FlaG [Chitinispirillaceae bacterium]|nr:flagellar protein FlaG [Chitinispirillaceae bacterium]
MAGDMGFTPEDSRVEEVSGIRKVYNEERGDKDSSRKEQKRKRPKRHPKEYMHTIGTAAKESNEQLARKGLPYRFCVHESGDEVIIDLVLLDSNGKIEKEIRRNITNEDFDRMIENISSLEGLFFDKTG